LTPIPPDPELSVVEVEAASPLPNVDVDVEDVVRLSRGIDRVDELSESLKAPPPPITLPVAEGFAMPLVMEPDEPPSPREHLYMLPRSTQLVPALQ
jgi:hypothetical protein